jgi:putative SOS response-associated peptidase YedK
MCGRFSLDAKNEELQEHFQTVNILDYSSRYNISPGQGIIVVRQSGSEPNMDLLHWGFKPNWSKTANFPTLINIRAETAHQKFRQTLQRRRCLIPATGFYEWQQTEQGKQPYHIKLVDYPLFAFAGLWEIGANDNSLSESCAILTTKANPELASIHSRMPVILTKDQYAAWLEPMQYDAMAINNLLGYKDIVLDIYPVSFKVNNSHYDAADCLEPQSIKA